MVSVFNILAPQMTKMVARALEHQGGVFLPGESCSSGLSLVLGFGAEARAVGGFGATEGSPHDFVGTTPGHRGTCCLETNRKCNVDKQPCYRAGSNKPTHPPLLLSGLLVHFPRPQFPVGGAAPPSWFLQGRGGGLILSFCPWLCTE